MLKKLHKNAPQKGYDNSSINNAINHFNFNICDASYKQNFNLELKKQKISISSYSGVDNKICKLTKSNEFVNTKDNKSFPCIISDLTHKLRKSFTNNTIEYSNQSDLLESITRSITYGFIPSQTKLTNQISLTSITNNNISLSITDTLKHFQQPTLSNSKIFNNKCSDKNLISKAVDLFRNKSEKSFFSDFVDTFDEKSKFSNAKRAIETETICTYLTNILLNADNYSNDNCSFRIKELLIKILNNKINYISKLIQPGYINLQLLTLTLIIYSLSQSIQLKNFNLQENLLFKCKSIQIFNEALIISGESLLPKINDINNFINEIDEIKIISDDFIKKIYNSNSNAVLISRNKWHHSKKLFQDTCKSTSTLENFNLLNNHLERRYKISSVYDYLDNEFEKANYHTRFNETYNNEIIDIEFNFIIIKPMILDSLLIPHAIIPV